MRSLSKNIKKFVTLSIVIVFISFLLSTFVSLYTIGKMASDNKKDMNILLASRINDTINSELSKPVMVAKTMAHCEFLTTFLNNSEALNSEKYNIQVMENYLSGIEEGMSYNSVFVISDNTKKYYTYKGLVKTIDPENDSHDVWYNIFKDSGDDFSLDVDNDESDNNIRTVFVNARMEKDGKFLGICGVGVKMESIQKIISDYEKEYNIKINLLDSEGVVQVDTNDINIDKATIDNLEIEEKNSNEYNYQQGKGGEYTVTKFIENLGWFLVVQSEAGVKTSTFAKIILLNVAFFVLVALAIVIAIILMRKHNNILLDTSYKDMLTGLFNRRAYEEELHDISVNGVKDDLIFVISDVNGLKYVNDNIGHSAGDELIKGASECLENTFNGYGNTYRIGGDEFASFLYVSEDEYNKLQLILETNIIKWHGKLVQNLSLSVGYVASKDYHGADISEMIKYADEKMYESKEQYYKKSGKDRRRI